MSASNEDKKAFLVRVFTEGDFKEMIRAAGGDDAYENADQEKKKNADFILDDAIIELKFINEERFEKPDAQRKIAKIFKETQSNCPVVILDPLILTQNKMVEYERIIEKPIKRHIVKANKQIKETRKKYPKSQKSIIFIVNNDSTSLDHETLIRLVERRVRNDTNQIDGVIIAGNYLIHDGFDFLFSFPIDFIQVSADDIEPIFKKISTSYDIFVKGFMSKVVQGDEISSREKKNIEDIVFEINGTRYIRPAPLMDKKSSLYKNGRPRKNTWIHNETVKTDLYPDFSYEEWLKSSQYLSGSMKIFDNYDTYQEYVQRVLNDNSTDMPRVPVPVVFEKWEKWCRENYCMPNPQALISYLEHNFNEKCAAIHKVEHTDILHIIPSSYIHLKLKEIGQDEANDICNIEYVKEGMFTQIFRESLLENKRICREYAMGLASSFAVAKKVDCVVLTRDDTYAWK